MPTLSAPGIGSGLDIEGIINSLMAVEQIPMQRLQLESAGYLAKISAYGQLRSVLAPFQDAVDKLKSFDDFNPVIASSSDAAFSASATTDAAPGNYRISVDAIAQAHKMGSASQTDPDTTTYGNAGDQLTISTSTGSFTIDYGGKTLSEIQTAINEATDNIGINAGIIRENDSSFYLSLTSEKTGLANAMSLSFTDSGGGAITDPFGFAQTQAALDAQITIDDVYVVESSENTISDAIQGVTINVHSQSSGTGQLSISRDENAISEAVEELVDAYNEMREDFVELSLGELSGDGTLRMIENQIRTTLGSSAGAGGAYSYASQVGISFQKDGTLKFNSSKLSDAVETDLNAVAELFANDSQGFAFRLSGLLDNMLGTDGVIDVREEGLNASIDSANDEIKQMQTRLEMVEARYRNQFTSLDLLLGELQATSSYVEAQLSSLERLLPSNSDN
ncbi:MAG: flagellar filament capping protein FliD [Gammaproteobacteria bacterium]|nr:flagellar filament capping protein FliD [Gammaproteobacteria bacterium]